MVLCNSVHIDRGGIINRIIRKELKKIYGNKCMAGFEVIKNNPITLHHIKFKSQGGDTSIDNGAIITNLPHTGIHQLIDDDITKLKIIKDYLIYYKDHPDELARLQFRDWLEDELERRGFYKTRTKSKLMVYKRRIR